MIPVPFEDSFLEECDEAITTMETVLVQLPLGATPPGAFDSAFRIAHSLKGGAAALGLVDISELSHDMEAVLEELRSERKLVSREVLDVLLRAVDLLRAMVGAHRGGTLPDPQAVADLHMELIVSGMPADGTPALACGAQPDVGQTTSIRILGDYAANGSDRGRIHVGVDTIDALVDQIGGLARGQEVIAALVAERQDPPGVQLRERVACQLRELRELEANVARLRCVPVSVLFRRIPRMVRDLASQLGKQVELRISGGDMRIDGTAVERIGDALVQLVRNAMDHGIETPEERRAAGKPECGMLWLAASEVGEAVVIEIGEDGAGLARDAIVSRARKGNLLPEDCELTDAAVDALIFLPGLTTLEKGTRVSGRGVGMDVVRSNVEAIGATIEVESRRGLGCRFRIVVPAKRGQTASPQRAGGRAGPRHAAGKQ